MARTRAHGDIRQKDPLHVTTLGVRPQINVLDPISGTGAVLRWPVRSSSIPRSRLHRKTFRLEPNSTGRCSAWRDRTKSGPCTPGVGTWSTTNSPPRCRSRTGGLPPALVVSGGCDVPRDEGRQYAHRLQGAGVAVEEICCAGQPHEFMNLGFPASGQAYVRIGDWLRAVFG
ncbi:MAG: alpha/beta hydrolase [Acidimicrobiales bacterium]